jgi:glycosyltransferase involved in cell wall biosynthesis
MKIIQANKFHYLRGGAERYVFELSKALEKAGHEIAPFAMQDPRNPPTPYDEFFVSRVLTEEADFGFEGLRTAGRMIYSFEAKRKFAALIEKAKPDVIHAHNIYHQISPSIFSAARAAGVPAVMTLHDYHLISPNYLMFDRNRRIDLSKDHPFLDTVRQRTIRGSFLASALSAFECWLHKTLDLYDGVRFIAPSDFVKKACVMYGVDADRIEVIPHFIDLEGKSPAESTEKSVVFVGRLSVEKGAEILVEAMSRIPDVKCVIVGEGPERTKLRRLASSLDLKNVEFAGRLVGDELWKRIAAARAVVVPSLTYETFGLTVLEAYAFGKPVVASRIGALPEVVREGETGLLAEAGNAADLAEKIAALANDEPRARRLGLAGRALAEREYAPAHHLKAVLKAYKQAKA